MAPQVGGRAWLLTAAILSALLLVRGGPVMESDFAEEAWRSYRPLQAGDWSAAWSAAPGYVGFILAVGFPSALLADLVGWGPVATFRLTAIPGALALGALGLMLATRARQAGSPPAWLVICLAAGSPVAWLSLNFGHAEDLLAASTAVGAVVAALHGRVGLATGALVVAIVSKQWAIFAVVPTLVALPHGALRAGLASLGAAVAVVALQGWSTPGSGSGSAVILGIGDRFHTRQIWWPLGTEPPPGSRADRMGELASPEWMLQAARPIVVGICVGLALLWAWQRRGRVTAEGVLALLALVFLVRCLIDPWNVPYYHLPLVLALLAWEVHRARRLPWVTLGTTVAVYASFWNWEDVSNNGAAAYALYFAWALPLATHLAWCAWRPLTPRPALSGNPARLPHTRRPDPASPL